MPLVVKGVRQCGKTFSVLQFAKSNYENLIYVDFFRQSAAKSLFDGDLDVDRICIELSLMDKNARFVPGKTCIVLDEIQECPRARTALKFFKLDGRYDVVCTGSLLGVSGYRTSNPTETTAPIPVGYEEIIEMYPLDFEEWLWANGVNERVVELLRNNLLSETPVNPAVHEQMKQLMMNYIVVGGMPNAVNTFLSTNNLNEVRALQCQIVDDYRSDMIKYAPNSFQSRIRECFDSIPRQLSRENRKFSYSEVRTGGRGRDYAGCLQWIEDAGIVRRCNNVEITELPLSSHLISEQFKIYMADIGLMVSMLDPGTAADIMTGNLYTFKGVVFESLMADILGKMGRRLFYFRKESGLEIDFIIRYRGKCTLVECKATTGNTKSSKTLLQHPEKYHVDQLLKFGDYNIGRVGQMLTLPSYMAFLITEI